MRALRSFRSKVTPPVVALMTIICASAQAQLLTTATRDPAQRQDTAFARLYREWTIEPKFGSPLVDHLPLVAGIPTPRDVLGYYIGAPRRLTYYADQLRYYRALAAATPRVKVETIGRSPEGRELVVVWVSSAENMKHLAQNRANLARLADPRGLSDSAIQRLIAGTRPDYHVMGGLHSGETGPSEMLMELVYRLATETSPVVDRIRDNVYVSITPDADADGRDRNVDWYYQTLARTDSDSAAARAARDSAGNGNGRGAGRGGRGGRGRGTAAADSDSTAGRGRGFGGRGAALPYWGKYVYHDNNRDINLSLDQMRAIANWYFTAHPPIMHDLHESETLMYDYSGGPPQNPNLDPILFGELSWYANFELSQMTKWGMPGVYDFAFMDAWSPGYLGSLAYNHNGMMKMYETQSGRDLTGEATATGRGAGGGRGRGGSDSSAGVAGGRGAGRGGRAAPGGRGGGAPGAGRGGPGGSGGVPTGRGGTQDREWYRGLPVGPTDIANFSRRANTNYMETGVLSALELTAMFPATVLEDFVTMTRNSIADGLTRAPHAFLIPMRPDMTRAAQLVNILRIQGIEVGRTRAPLHVGDSTYAAGAYLIKLDQPYGRLAKNLLEKQVFPDARLSTYDDSGWTMGLEMLVDVVTVDDSTVLTTPTEAVDSAVVRGTVTGSGSAALAVADYGSNNMITFRYRLRDVPMSIAEKSFTAGGVTFPAGSFVITDRAHLGEIRSAVVDLGLTAAELDSTPAVPEHDANVPRIAIYSQWSNTQDLGWYRLTLDKFHIPYDLIFKEQVEQGNLRQRYDVILMADQAINRQTVLQPAAAQPVPYEQTARYRFLGMYGSSPDITGGFGQKGVDAFADFLSGGGTLIAIGDAARFPIDFGWAHTADTSRVAGVNAEHPIIAGRILHPGHPVFYGYGSREIPIKYVGGSALRVGLADQQHVLAEYVGGDSAVLSGLMVGADSVRGKAFAVDVPGADNGKGRVILFANDPIYRWQNHGEFNMVFNAIMNWDDVPAEAP